MKKSLCLIPIAFLIGAVIGAWGPMNDIKTLKEKPKEEKKSPKANAADGFGNFAKLVNIPDEARHPNHHRDLSMKKNATNEVVVIGSDGVKTNKVAASEKQPAKNRQPEDLRARLEEARGLWQTRVDMARATAIANLRLDDEGAKKFDDALAVMNDKLLESMETITEMLKDKEKMTPELGIRLMGDLTTTMAECYDQIGQSVDPSMRDDVSALELYNFIDPAVAEPLIQVQGKLDMGR